MRCYWSRERGRGGGSYCNAIVVDGKKLLVVPIIAIGSESATTKLRQRMNLQEASMLLFSRK